MTPFDHRFTVLEELQSGGSRRILRAHHKALDRHVLLFILELESLPDDEATLLRDRFLARARLTASVSHPALQTVYDCHALTGSVYAALEDLQHGTPLRAALSGGTPFSVRRTLDLLLPLLDAVALLHHHGSHGLSLSPDALVLCPSPLGERLVRTTFSPPPRHEAYTASPPSSTSDLFALTVLTTEMLTGPPSTSPPSALAKHPLHPILSRALHPDPKQRFTSAIELKAALTALPDEALDAPLQPIAPQRPDGMRFRSLATLPATPPPELASDPPLHLPTSDLGVFAELFEGHYRVLIVDDDPDMRDLFEAILDTMGIQVITARNGAEGLQRAFTQQPDLVLVDQLMPKMSGFEFLERLRDNATTQAIPTIMVTSQSSLEDKITGLKLGADDYITKPFDPSELLARVGATLRRNNVDKIVDPVTKLPGPSAVASRLNDQLANGLPFQLACICLRPFQEFLALHGFTAANTLLSRTARVLYHAVTAQGRMNDFLGHINLNNFALFLSPISGEAVCRQLLERFAAMRAQHDATLITPVLSIAWIHVDPSRFPKHTRFATHVHQCLASIQDTGQDQWLAFHNLDTQGTPIT